MSEQSNSSQEEKNEGFNFVDAELEVLKFWEQNKIFERSLEQTKNCPPYIFYDGPPFATGLPHHGHLVASTIKDIIPRYFTMQGRYVERRFGWDCHGLPIEQEIDKKFGMSASDYVEKNGVKSYNSECRGIVQRYTKEWEKTITRLGRWVDFENDYKTMDLSFMESIWWVFKQAWDKELIYQGTKIVPFSTALGTGLSNFEATSNYQSVQDPAVTVLFKLVEEDASIAAWTTTPWTLPSNLFLCVNPELDYQLVEDELGRRIYFAKERVEAYSKKNTLTVIKEVKGKELMGKTYAPLFNFFEKLKDDGAFQVLGDGYVTTTDGTGIVHVAPAFGEDDNRVAKEAGYPQLIVSPVDDAGKFTSEVSQWEGIYVKEADKTIIKDLKERDQLFEQSTLVHNYPFCPRTDTPLIYRAMPQWYLKVEEIKSDIINSNQQIRWVPGHIKEGRFGKWLEGARDWAISRNRYWGTPLPIWINSESGKKICIGSIEELQQLTGTQVDDLHRETVDGLEFSIDGESGVYRRIPEVLDCWFESGSMPYAQLHYPFENQEVFEKGYPAEFIAEGLDQTRGWFYTLNVLSSMLYQKPAFKNVIVNGMVLAGDGRKMSKRLKNYTEPDILMREFGADALRLFLINSGLVKGEELRFTDDGLKEMVRKALLPWFNSFKFFQTYAKIDGWKAKQDSTQSSNILDQWLNSKAQTLVKEVSFEMENYRLYNVVGKLFNFIEDLTNWYIRLNRRRYWQDDMNQDKHFAYQSLFNALQTTSKVMAPFAPFLSEHIFRELGEFGELEKESVHLCSFPKPNLELQHKALEDAVERTFQIMLLGRQKRNQVKIKVKTPLRSLTVINSNPEVLEQIKKLESYIKTELNIKEIRYSSDEASFIKLYAKPNSPVLGKRLGKKFGPMRKEIESLSSSQLSAIESGQTVELMDEKLTSEDILIFREPLEGTQALSNRYISIDIDCNLDDDLIQEGLAREVVNRIQRSRKEKNFEVSDRIEVQFNGDPKLVEAIQKHAQYIKDETLCHSLNTGPKCEELDFEIDGLSLKMNIKKA